MLQYHTGSLTPVLRLCRLLCVQHVEENKKPVLYLVSGPLHPKSHLCLRCRSCSGLDEERVYCALQVFEYLSTDLKKFMDRNGKGPNYPLNPKLIKVYYAALLFEQEADANHDSINVLPRYRSCGRCMHVIEPGRDRCDITDLPLHLLQSFMYQMIKGVAHCHKHGVMHRWVALLYSNAL